MFEIEFGKFEGFVYRERRPSNKLVAGNDINNSPFIVAPTIAGKKVSHPACKTWCNMLERSFNLDFKNRQPAYADVTCCEDWLTFTNFAKWFASNYIKNYQLDKDLLVKNNRMYGPNYCLFVPKEINLFIALGSYAQSTLPLVVSLENNVYRARIGSKSKNKNLGNYSTKEQAHQAWQKAKLEQAIAFNFPPLQRIINQLKFEIANNLETTSL